VNVDAVPVNEKNPLSVILLNEVYIAPPFSVLEHEVNEHEFLIVNLPSPLIVE
jgi:hypothetical protein